MSDGETIDEVIANGRDAFAAWIPNVNGTESRAAIQFMGTIAEWMLALL